MAYYTIYAAAVPNANRQQFIDQAETMAQLFIQHGALEYKECWGDDVPDGSITSFPMAVKKTDDESVVVGWVKWPSKQVSDAGWGKIMEDPSAMPQGGQMPFDGKRMIFGGFSEIVSVVKQS